jgi:hypothetical protein
MTSSDQHLTGLKKITKVIEFVFVLRSLLGLLVLGVLSLWLSPFQHHLSWFYTQSGLLVVLYTLGALTTGVPLVCWLITSCLPQSTQSD